MTTTKINRTKSLSKLKQKQDKERFNLYKELDLNQREVLVPLETALKLPNIYEVDMKTKRVYLRA